MTSFAVVLAGGQGSRLGFVRKADLRLAGQTLLQRVTARLPVEEILPPLLDLPGMAGPLAGLAAAVHYLRGRARGDDVVVSVAVDTPFLPEDFVARLVEAAGQAGAAFAAWRDSDYPTNAAYRFDTIRHLPEQADGIGSPKRLLAMLDAVRIDWPEAAEDPFRNLNTLGDLIALARRAK